MKLGKQITKHYKLIILIAVLLMIPSVIGMMNTRINYDMLTYLPSDMDTITGQDILLDDFGKGAFSFVVVENMSEKDVVALKEKYEKINHVDTVLWYDSLVDISVPMEMIPDKLYDAFNSGDATLIAIFFDSSMSSDDTMNAIREIRSVSSEQCFVSGMSAMVTDLKDLCEQEEPIYVAIAVALAVVAMMLFLDSWLIPFIFLASIGIAILINMGSNFFLGEVSYITKALSAVLQLAVTMDYSIFLWHSYNEELETESDHKKAMAEAIHKTFSAVLGSSITTVAGFIALCFMSFTLGKDLGIVMAKGVVLGVIGCVTVLPAMILLFDKALQKSKHKSLIPKMDWLVNGVVKFFPVILVLFVVVAVPSYMGYQKANDEVYYNLASSLPEDMQYMVANTELSEKFDVAATHMVLFDSTKPSKEVKKMIKEMEDVDGVNYVLGLESIVGSNIPEELIPDSIKEILENDGWELMLINSKYQVATDEANAQVDQLNNILKKYDEKGLLIGEAPCMKDMITVTNQDFIVVNSISIIAIFIIILLVEKSLSLPIILVAVIELAIFINLAFAHLTGVSLPFIAPICISTIQLGATVDYAILMTTRYKSERFHGKDKKEAVSIALSTSIPSIIVSAMGLFAATFGVAMYSNIDIISSICMLLARGAIISMFCVILVLPAMLMLFDKVISKTTIGFLPKKNKEEKKVVSSIQGPTTV